MSYQEYAQLGRNTQRDNGNNHNTNRAPQPPRLRTDRPYTGSVASFSVPRKSPPHSSSSSTSSASLSPSNSASQIKAGSLSPTSQWSDGLNTHAQLKNLELGTATDKRPELIDVSLPWRPFYLQRKVLICFIITFAGLAVCLEALLGYATRNNGLETSPANAYLWRLAPTALLTLVTALWSRVEYQSQHAAPWYRLSLGAADADRTLLLDYISLPQPVAILTALRNRDLSVAAATAVSMFLKLQVVVSAGLIFTSLVSLPAQTTPVTVQTAFVNNGSGLADGSALAFYTMLGLQQEGLLFPEGVAPTFAYQRFDTDQAMVAGSTVSATVDGLSAGLECEVASVGLAGVGMSGGGVQVFNTSFLVAGTGTAGGGGCNVSMPVSGRQFLRTTTPSGTAANQTTNYFARFGQGGCNGSTAVPDQRIVVVFGTETFIARPANGTTTTTTPVVSGTIPRSAALVCKPSYAVSRLDVSKKDGGIVGIAPSLQPQERALANVEAWGIADGFFASFRNGLAESKYSDTTPWFYEPGVVNVDPIMYLALDFRFRSTGIPVEPDALLNPAVLQDVVGDYFQQYVPLVASRSLMKEESSLVTAVAAVTSERLMVSFAVTQFVVVHLAVAAFLTVGMVFLVPKKGFLPRDPGTIMDTAALIINSRGLLQSLRGVGGGDANALRERVVGPEYYTGVEAYERADSKGSGYFRIFGGHSEQQEPVYTEPTDKFPHPGLLHPASRLTGILVTTSLIIGLDFALQASGKNGGFADAVDEEHRHLLWTVVPAVVFGLVAMYFVSAGFIIRILSPYAALTRGATFEQSVNSNLVDRASPLVIYQALKSRNLAVGSATVAAVASSLFVMFAASLFMVTIVPTTADCRLLTDDFFAQSNGAPDDGFCTTCQNGTVLASLVLNGNVSYPGFTYADLAFPSLTLVSVPEDMSSLPDDVIITATIPGVRPSMQCRRFQQSELSVSFNLSTFTGTGNPMQVIFPVGAGSTDNAADNTMTINTGPNLSSTNTMDPNAFFGAGAYKPLPLADSNTPRWLYIWGQLQNAGTSQPAIRSLSGLACNESVFSLNVAVRFLGGSLDIDAVNPPVPDESSLVPVPLALDGNLDYNTLVTLSTPHILDPFFMSLTASRFAIPPSHLADSSLASQVAEAITRQHVLIRTQIISAWNRRPTTLEPSLAFPLDVNGTVMGNATELAFPARLTINSLPSGAARRVVQDMVSTRVLQALLAAVLVASGAAWLALPKGNLLPRMPTSIASVAGFLADGNMFGLMGRGAEWQGVAELLKYFRDGLHVTMGFRLGWERPKRRRNVGGMGEEVFAVTAVRTGGWGGGENVGLGLQARVGYAQRDFVRDWGWRT
ncbi:hypothetical protein OQA88_2265 [Cercophora sp. LCS_1]